MSAKNTRIIQDADHRHKIVKEAARLLEEVPARRKSLVKLYNQSQLVLDPSLQRRGITTLGMIPWFPKDLDEYLATKPQETVPQEKGLPSYKRFDRLIAVLEGIKESLDKIVVNTDPAARRKTTLQKIVSPVHTPPQPKPVPVNERRKLRVLVAGLQPDQKNHLEERSRLFAKLKYLDNDRNRTDNTFPTVDIIFLSNHVSHGMEAQLRKNYPGVRIEKATTNTQSMSDRIRFYWEKQTR